MMCGNAGKKLRRSSRMPGSPVLRLLRVSLAATAANILLVPLLLVSSPRSYSQEITGGVTVVVQDSSGAAVSGANLVLTKVATGEKTSGVSNNVGLYTYNLVQPGAYRLT